MSGLFVLGFTIENTNIHVIFLLPIRSVRDWAVQFYSCELLFGYILDSSLALFIGA